jgi:CDP-glycerol glycerophosphotransferase (TagB/SpsB family)
VGVRALLWKHGGEKVALAARLIELPARSLVRLVVGRLDRDPNLWVFGAARNRFADNVAYLYLYAAERAEGRRCVWVTGSTALRRRLRSAGLEAETRWSWRGIAVCARASWYVTSAYVSDINRWFADGARVLNVWHGVPLKRIERDIRSGPLTLVYSERQPMKVAFRDETRPPDYLLAPSQYIAERCFVSAFAVPPERCLPFGYPRTDHFFEPAQLPHGLLVAEIDRWRALSRRKRIVGFFPTWRDFQPSESFASDDLTSLSAALSSIDAHLVFKPHFNDETSVGAAGLTVLAPEDDADAYLPLCDVLVTDYSSLAFDFMLLGRPIVYFVPDFDDYAAYRGLYFDAEEMMPGPLIKDGADLVPAIKEALVSRPGQQLAKVREVVWGSYGGDARERLLAFLLAHSGDGAASPRGQVDHPMRSRLPAEPER